MTGRGDLAPRLGLLALLSGVLVAGGGCSHEPVAGDDTVEVVVWNEDTDAPAARVKIALFDDEQHLAAAAAASDLTGRCVFVPDRPARRVIALTGDSLRVVSLPPALAPGDGSVTVRVRQRIQTGQLPRITGVVVDSLSGEPLSGAFVSLSPFLSGFLGRTDTSDDVTLADGAFRVSDIPFAVDPVSGNLSQVVPLIVTCEGYLPRAWRHHPQPGDLNVDIRGVVIPLVPDPGGSGRLEGRVLFGTQPVVDLLVGLGSVGAAPAKSGAGWPGHVARTDGEGRFAFTGLAAGRFVVQPGFALDDGWAFPSQPNNVVREVTSGGVTQTGDLQVVPSVTAVAPVDTIVAAAGLVFRWRVATARPDSFVLYVDGQRRGSTSGTSLAPDALTLLQGWHNWFVNGLSAEHELLAASETLAWFRVTTAP